MYLFLELNKIEVHTMEWLIISASFLMLHNHYKYSILPQCQHRMFCCCCCTAITQHYWLFVYCTVYIIKLLNTIECTIHKQPITFCVIVVQKQQTEYPMLSKRQHAVFVWSTRKDTKIHNQPLNCMNFDFVHLNEKVLLSLCCN